MKHLRRFTGAVLGLFIGFFDLVAIIGMPWEPDLSSSRDRWIVATLGLFGLLGSFWAGWVQRGQESMAEAEKLSAQIGELKARNGELKAGNGELTTQLEAEKTRAASVNGLEDKLAHAQERIAELEAASESTGTDADEAEKRRKAIQYARNLALGLSYDDKSFLLALEKHGCIQFEDVSSWDVSSDLDGVRRLVEQTEVACNVHRVWLNERGRFVLQEARDILEMLVPGETGEDLWWSYGTFVGDLHEGLMGGGDE